MSQKTFSVWWLTCCLIGLRFGVYRDRSPYLGYTFTLIYPKSSKILLLVLLDFDWFSTPQYSPSNRACSHVYQIHQNPPAAFDGFSTPQYSPSNRACSHVYQIHQTPTGCFCWIQDCVQPSHGCFAFVTVPIPSKSSDWGIFLLHVDGLWQIWDGF